MKTRWSEHLEPLAALFSQNRRRYHRYTLAMVQETYAMTFYFMMLNRVPTAREINIFWRGRFTARDARALRQMTEVQA
jgi:hypothetical protein